MKDLNKLYLPGRESDETIIVALRQHVIVIIKKIVVFVVLTVIITVILVLFRTYTNLFSDKTSLGYVLFVLVASLIYLFLLLYIYQAWVIYYLNIWIVTNKRVVNVEQKSLFHREVAELQLDKVQDVSSDVRGLVPTILKYGTIEVQTASEQDKFIFNRVPNPDTVASQILELHEQYLANHPEFSRPLEPKGMAQNQSKPQNNEAKPV